MTADKAIHLFYIFFEGIMLFQVVFFGMVYLISRRKDTLYYAMLNLVGAAYFALNAPHTFLGLDTETFFNSKRYLYLNFGIFISLFLIYTVFLKEIFADTLVRFTYMRKFYKITIIVIPLYYVIFVLFHVAGWNADIIFYSSHLLNAPFVSMLLFHNIRQKGYKAMIINGMFVVFVCLVLTIIFTVRYNNGKTTYILDRYPLVIMRIGMLIDIIIFQLVLLKRWNDNEKQLTVEKLQSQLAVEKLRNRISGELHDDIGSTLSGVSMYSHMATHLLEKGEHEKAKDSLKVIRQSVTNIVENLKGLVWAVQPNQHSFEVLMEKLTEFGYNICEAKQIKFNLPSNNLSAPFQLTEEQSYEIYLCLKEAINNAAKYSNAKTITLDYQVTDNTIKLSVSDDGNGFDINNVKQGNGLSNMQKRMTNIGARFEMLSKPNNGTVVRAIINF